MKKFFALLMALVMVFSLSTVAFADTPRTDTVEGASVNNTEKTGTVKVTVSAGDKETLYHVLVSWESLEFSYQASGSTWNAKTHKYEFSNGNWTDNSATIKVENHSNAGVSYSAAYANGATADAGVTISLSGDTNKALASADSDTYRAGEEGSLANGYQKGDQGSITVTADGAPTENATGTVAMGVVTITITH